MAENSFENDIRHCLTALRSGGVILFPTDTIWGIGCDATNEVAVSKVLYIKQRQAAQGLITLITDMEDIERYTNGVTTTIAQEIVQQKKPTTIIYNGAKNLAANVIPTDGTIAIRLVKETFCYNLLQQFGKPIISTSANIHGQPSPQNFLQINEVVIRQVNYVVQYRQQEQLLFRPSTILKIKPDGSFETIRP